MLQGTRCHPPNSRRSWRNDAQDDSRHLPFCLKVLHGTTTSLSPNMTATSAFAAAYRQRGLPTTAVVMGLYFGASSWENFYDIKEPGWFRVAYLVLVSLVSLWFIFRLSRVVLRTNDLGIRVVNPLRTYVMPWVEIESFSVDARGWVVPAVTVRRTGRRPLRVSALLFAGSLDPKTEKMLEELNDKLSRANAEENTPS